MPGKRVLSVGQCIPDHGSIAHTLERHFQAEVVAAATAAEALAQLDKEAYDLVLVNRVFDWDGDSGLELIKQLKSADHGRTIPVMLVSNYKDAQQEAVAAGAVPGFGKSTLGHPEMLDRVRSILS